MMTPDKAWDFEALGWDGKQLPELAKSWLYHAVVYWAYHGYIMGVYYSRDMFMMFYDVYV
jgi:hypothetical protein